MLPKVHDNYKSVPHYAANSIAAVSVTRSIFN